MISWEGNCSKLAQESLTGLCSVMGLLFHADMSHCRYSWTSFYLSGNLMVQINVNREESQTN